MISILEQELLSRYKYPLSRYRFASTRLDGKRQEQNREVYERADGVSILLYNLSKRTLLMTRQVRLPVFLSGNTEERENGFLLEACAGTLENESPEEGMIRETEEETGYRIRKLHKVAQCFVSPASTTEKLTLYISEYDESMKVSKGGGLENEAEDIDVLELSYDEMNSRLRKGEIRDAKTIILLQYLSLEIFSSAGV